MLMSSGSNVCVPCLALCYSKDIKADEETVMLAHANRELDLPRSLHVRLKGSFKIRQYMIVITGHFSRGHL